MVPGGPVISTEGRSRKPRLVIEATFGIIGPSVPYGHGVSHCSALHDDGIGINSRFSHVKIPIFAGNFKTPEQSIPSQQPTIDIPKMKTNGVALNSHRFVYRS